MGRETKGIQVETSDGHSPKVVRVRIGKGLPRRRKLAITFMPNTATARTRLTPQLFDLNAKNGKRDW